LANFAYKTTGTKCNGAVLTEGGFIGMVPPTPGEQFRSSVAGMLDERGLYDCPLDGDRHYLARRVAERLGMTVLDFYDVMITLKQERTAIAAERGVFHADSAHDGCCYVAMKADYIAGK
jgi:hypothetical protein